MRFSSWILGLMILFSAGFSSCSVEPRAIEYGKDACAFCRMTIMDPQHAAELVTRKGKIFTFDAIECMVNKRTEFQEDEIAIELVCDYLNPGVWVEASKATFIIYPKIPSPMGANLSAFSDPGKLLELIAGDSVQTLNWQQVQQKLGRRPI